MAKNNDILEYFDNIYTFVDTIQTRPHSTGFFKESESTSVHNIKFTHTKSLEEANDLFKNGDTQNHKKIEKAFIKDLRLSDELTSRIKTTLENSVCGGIPNVPAYIMGLPQQMINIKRAKVIYPSISVVINYDYHCKIKTDQIITAGAKILSVINALQNAGINIGIYGFFSSTESNQNITLLVREKEGKQPTNTLALAYPIVNPSFIRRHTFKWIETKEGINTDFAYQYGRPRKATKKILEELNLPFLKGAVIVSFMDIINNNKSIEDITKDLTANLK